MGLFGRRFTTIDAANLMTRILLKKEENISADKILKILNDELSEKGYDKSKAIVRELTLFDDFCLSSQLQKEASILKKEKLGEKIWNEYCTILMRTMGEGVYNDYVAKATQRKTGYSNIFSPEEFMSKADLVFWGYVLDETPRYTLDEFNYEGSPDIIISHGLKMYLSKRMMELTEICRDILNKTTP